MNPHRDPLSQALRELASTSPAASPDLHARLDDAFVHHHARRRMQQRVAIFVALAVCALVSMYWLRPSGPVAKIKTVEPATQATQVPAPQAVAPQDRPQPQPQAVAQVAPKPRLPQQVNKHRNQPAEPVLAAETGDFVALPTFDPAVPLGESRMVRMDLPGSALQLIGYPVDGQLLDRRILTDVLVGQDGMPYAVRLVHARNVH